jgi:sulfite reductase (NADPH) hemoprotein beta-component
MYKYTKLDKKIVTHRVEEFRGQVNRRINGELSEDEFKPLRLMNGLYLQLHAYMLRIAIPYGELSSEQMYKLAEISDKYDRGYGHFTTRQNIQLNWPKLTDVPNILKELAEVEMHAIQTSGNCIRNITTDHLAGLTKDEVEDPRPWCELIRKWSTFHPEFTFLPRKFKIAITGSLEDRAAIEVHDIGLRLIKLNKEIGFEVFVGGGQGRSPFIAKKIKEFIKKEDILSYLEAILRAYNELGRRDNIYKARIKILVHELGISSFKKIVEEEWGKIKNKNFINAKKEIDDLKKVFKIPDLKSNINKKEIEKNKEFKIWVKQNTKKHKISGHSIVFISLKPLKIPPGDMSSDQMKMISKVAKEFSFSEIRVTHEQNLVLPHVKNDDLSKVWNIIKKKNLATPNIGLLSDSICCPGLDYCALATARSIPIAQRISDYFNSFEKQKIIGEMKIKISGCINACGHHHVGNIGILGLDRNGEEFYQITLGGSAKEDSKIGEIIGPSFPSEKIIEAIDTIIEVYLTKRTHKKETFLKTLELIGLKPFKEALYDNH